MTIEERLERLEGMLPLLERMESMVAVLVERQQIRAFYSISEFAQLVGRAPFTVREWARAGRIRTERKGSGRGSFLAYSISHQEYLRFQKEGLLPVNHHHVNNHGNVNRD